MIKRFSVAAVALTLAVTACDSLKDAVSAHSNVAAKAVGHELTVTELANLIGNSQAPLRRDVINAVADAWVDYHLAAEAAVNNDTLTDPKLADKVLWAAIANVKAKMWYDLVSKNWAIPDSSAAEAFYNSGQVLAASHILLVTQGMPDSAKATIKRKAEAIHAQATSANFAELARKNSQDPGSKIKGGALGTFARGAMVPQFEQALLATKPGEISPVIETQYGFHIIRRPLFSEVRSDVVKASHQAGLQAAESTYLATLERASDLKIKPGISAAVRATTEDPRTHESDKTVLATSDIGDFTAARLAKWVETIPAQAQIGERIKSAPVSLLPGFIKNFVRNELVIHAADSAKVGPSKMQLTQIRAFLSTSLITAWSALEIDPRILAVNAKSKADRAKFAHQKVDQHIRDLLAQKAQYVDVTSPVQAALREKYDWSINSDAVARALVEAAKVRLHADSTKTAGQPASVVPVPKRDTTKR
ncbi:MAG TPA: peptidylprolyl isomerase [Gemmatimonadaceae bacterium]